VFPKDGLKSDKVKEDGEMFKKFGMGILISGALVFGYCTLNTAFINTAIAEEEDKKKDDELMNSHRARSTAYISTIISNEDVCDKCGKKKEDCTCEV